MPGWAGPRHPGLCELAARDDAALSPGPDLMRVFAACEGEERLRDRAIVLLLARLGLRASEVAHLSFHRSTGPRAGSTIIGKARREERLPLTQEVGDALISYIERSRPRVATKRVFLTDIALRGPPQPRRGEVHRAPGPEPGRRREPHIAARMCCGTRRRPTMFRHGVSLAGVGAVLRHRSPSMTAHYAKVDIAVCSRDRAALGWEAAMLNEDADRYIALRRTLGYKLRKTARHLRAFARYADERGETHVRVATVLAWVTAAGRTRGRPGRRCVI